MEMSIKLHSRVPIGTFRTGDVRHAMRTLGLSRHELDRMLGGDPVHKWGDPTFRELQVLLSRGEGSAELRQAVHLAIIAKAEQCIREIADVVKADVFANGDAAQDSPEGRGVLLRGR